MDQLDKMLEKTRPISSALALGISVGERVQSITKLKHWIKFE